MMKHNNNNTKPTQCSTSEQQQMDNWDYCDTVVSKDEVEGDVAIDKKDSTVTEEVGRCLSTVC